MCWSERCLTVDQKDFFHFAKQNELAYSCLATIFTQQNRQTIILAIEFDCLNEINEHEPCLFGNSSCTIEVN